MANQVPNHFKQLLAQKVIDFANDAFKIILMVSGFTFNKDTHEKYADVLANELATGSGYTQGTKAITVASVDQDDTNDRANVVFNSVSWTASGGDIGPSPGAIIYDDTHADDVIVGYIDFAGEYTQADGGTATIAGVELRLT